MLRVAASCLLVILKFATVLNRLAYSLLDWIFTSTDTLLQVYIDRSHTLMSVERSETSVTGVSDTVPDAYVHDLCRASNVNLSNEFTSDNSKGATSSSYGISNRIQDDSSKQSTALNKTISREQVKGKEGSTTAKTQLADTSISEKFDMSNFGRFGTARSPEGLALSPVIQVNEKEESTVIKTQLADICRSEKYDIGNFGPFGTARSSEGLVTCAVSGRICVTRVQSKDELVKPTARSPETAARSRNLQNISVKQCLPSSSEPENQSEPFSIEEHTDQPTIEETAAVEGKKDTPKLKGQKILSFPLKDL